MAGKEIKRVPCSHPDCSAVWPAKHWLEPRDFKQYRGDGWGYLYTDAGIRYACPKHKEQPVLANAAL